jgi:UDP-N-acetylglucosamine/UDP-N-acetylgalactosamine 4-epimerase
MVGAAGVPAALALVRAELIRQPRRWLVTGSAGFIGSHLVEALLVLGQEVVSVDNFATGYRRNLDEVTAAVGADSARRHTFIEADLADLAACRAACKGVDVVLHEGALGSVPRSIEDPLATHATNATGFLNVLVAARDAGVKRVVYASSSSVYGDHPGLPKIEDAIGQPLSPYAVTKQVDEQYAEVFGRVYSLATAGLRYFNVFGPRQDPEGAYAAVIPRWVRAMLIGAQVAIHGDGETTRDFCHVDNVVQANLLAATVEGAAGRVYNVAVGERTSLNVLHATIAGLVREGHPGLAIAAPMHGDFRPGDVRHSLADIARARTHLGYEPTHDLRSGLRASLSWYERRFAADSAPGIREGSNVHGAA